MLSEALDKKAGRGGDRIQILPAALYRCSCDGKLFKQKLTLNGRSEG